jgi:hypothetical protein
MRLRRGWNEVGNVAEALNDFDSGHGTFSTACVFARIGAEVL